MASEEGGYKGIKGFWSLDSTNRQSRLTINNRPEKNTWDQKNKYFKIRTITWETCSHTIHWVFRGILLQLYYHSLKYAYTWVSFMSLIPDSVSFSCASQKLPQRRLTSPQAEENSVFAFLEQEPWLTNFLTMDFIFVLPTYLFCQGN